VSPQRKSEIPWATPVSEAVEKLAELLCPQQPWDAAARQLQQTRLDEKIQMLVMGWPSLAATLAQLLEENQHRVPLSLKIAYQIVDQERRKEGGR
jgi:hypothetical protein